MILRKPLSTSLQRYAETPRAPYDRIDKKHEEEVEHEKIPQHPEEVSSTSSVHEVFHEKGVEEGEKDEDVLAGIKADIVRPTTSGEEAFADSKMFRKLSRKPLPSMKFPAKH